MSGKTLLKRDKELAKWWASVSHDDRFEQVCALARAELFEAGVSQEKLAGANLVITTLTEFVDNDAGSTKFPNPGLVHQMPERKTIEDKKQ